MTKLFFVNFFLCILLVGIDIVMRVFTYQHENFVDALKTFFTNDSVVYAYMIWLPVMVESLMLNTVILAAKLYIRHTNRK